ncbi:DUF814 domain-containing protein [Candidatus Woesearchaeota archaeon]|nr:DUF814 domain-containing protein [Candidatus Woesearchaeota archaeon]
MLIKLNLKKSVNENASEYFEKAKKFRKKLEGSLETKNKYEQKLKELVEKQKVEEENKIEVSDRKKHWYEKFRWFFTSTGFLVIGGRDATSNEIVIKKHTDPEDLVFHTDMAGSPFFVLKTEGKDVDKETLKEVANATCTFSRAWKLELQTQKVFYVKPEQVSKTPKSGEYLSKGAFMIYGKTNYIDNSVDLCVCKLEDGSLMAAPENAVRKKSKDYVKLIQGREKPSSVAKVIKKELNYNDLDDIIRILPAGGFKIVKHA